MSDNDSDIRDVWYDSSWTDVVVDTTILAVLYGSYSGSGKEHEGWIQLSP